MDKLKPNLSRAKRIFVSQRIFLFTESFSVKVTGQIETLSNKLNNQLVGGIKYIIFYRFISFFYLCGKL